MKVQDPSIGGEISRFFSRKLSLWALIYNYVIIQPLCEFYYIMGITSGSSGAWEGSYPYTVHVNREWIVED